MTILQSLKSLSSYPIPTATIQDVAEGVRLDVNTVVTPEIRKGEQYLRAKAKVYLFLSEAPNVSQGGISYSFSPEERRLFRLKAENILDEIGDTEGDSCVEFGYKGEYL